METKESVATIVEEEDLDTMVLGAINLEADDLEMLTASATSGKFADGGIQPFHPNLPSGSL
jgi:hypothetical protein